MHVNAQVTAVTTMMEFSGNCISFVIFIVLGGHGKFTSSVSIMFLNFVVLSYAFLMNTKYNKNRIIEDGWMNVLKNMFFCYKCTIRAPDRSANEASSHREKINDAEKKPDTPDIFLMSKTSQSVTSKKNSVKTFPKRIDGESTESDSGTQNPTCSYKAEELTNLSNEFTQKGSNVNDTKSIDTFRQKMISDLLYYIEDEDTYIKILTHN